MAAALARATARGSGYLAVLGLNLTGVLKGQDFDGDAVPLSGNLITVNVENDVPALSGQPLAVKVYEDSMTGAAGGDLSTGNRDNNGDGIIDGTDAPVNGDETTITYAQLKALVSEGA